MTQPAAIRIFIPTLNAGPEFERTLEALTSQRAEYELMIVDSGSTDGTVERARAAGARVEVIDKSEFDHGGTRNRAARDFHGEVLVFLTQDAIPTDEGWLENLTGPILAGDVVAAYGRQVPKRDALPPEAFARRYNYPERSREKSWNDLDTLGVKTFFFSNVCSAVARDAFEAVGRFPERTIMNEDMILAVRLLRQGGRIRYAADAAVYHSHNYGLGQQFRRNFDIGVFFSHWREELPDVTVSGEGVRFVRRQCADLLANGHALRIPGVLLESGAKFLGYQLGRRAEALPGPLRKNFSMHKAYWHS